MSSKKFIIENYLSSEVPETHSFRTKQLLTISQLFIVNPCELHCRPVNEYFSEKMLDSVTDGTPCFMNNKSRNICINGVCKVVWLGKRLKETGGS